jgi:hypothetical protein
VRERTLKRKNHSASGRQAAFERVASGRVASGAGAFGALVRGSGGGSGRLRSSSHRGPSDPGAGYKEGKDRAPQQRGA